MSSAIAILAIAVLGVTVLGFFAARWGRADLQNLEQWALGGRNFGTIVSWFLLGGDLYTAYTFIAVPALVYGIGALGFFAVPYAIIAYPVALIVLGRFWSVARRRGYVTSADFVRDRYGDRSLEIAVALTGVVAAMPYIALQLVGMRAVFAQFGALGAFGSIPALTVAFLLVAAYTYTSGLRAPALIAFVKDTLIYVTVIAAIVVIPARLGGWAHVFATAQTVLARRPHPSSVYLTPPQYFTYASMAFGNALALFIYPHSITSVLAARSRGVVRRNAALLPIYSLLLGLLALLGYCAVAAGITSKDSTNIVPLLFARFFPGLVCGHRSLRGRHRRPGAGRDHVHRRFEPLCEQRLPRVFVGAAEYRDARRQNAHDRHLRVRSALHFLRSGSVCDRLPAARRSADAADLSRLRPGICGRAGSMRRRCSPVGPAVSSPAARWPTPRASHRTIRCTRSADRSRA